MCSGNSIHSSNWLPMANRRSMNTHSPELLPPFTPQNDSDKIHFITDSGGFEFSMPLGVAVDGSPKPIWKVDIWLQSMTT